MKIKICHLYYDLLNLYGEHGNVLALTKAFNKQKITCEIDTLSVGDEINFNDYDVIYLGTGSEENLLIALSDIKRHRKALKEVIKKGTYVIATGNSHELFGKFFEINNEKHPALGIFNYYAKQNQPKRIVGDSLMKFKDLEPVIGFQNRACVLQNEDHHLFEVINGYADNFKASHEGYYEYNFIGTYLIGPLLIRNPHLTDYIVKDILSHTKTKYQEHKNTYEYRAYEEYIKNFYDDET